MLTGCWWEGHILVNLCGKENMRNCNLLQMGFFARFRTVLGLAKIFFCRVCKKPQRWGFPQGLRKQKQETTCFHAVVSFAKEETETGNTYGSGRPARPVEAKILQRHPQKKFRRCSASESVFAGIFGSKFPGFPRLQKRVFGRRRVEDLTNSRSGSQIFDKCMCHVCHDVCGAWGEDWQAGHSEDKSNWFSLIIILLLVVLLFECFKFELFVSELWKVLTHEYNKVSIHTTYD